MSEPITVTGKMCIRDRGNSSPSTPYTVNAKGQGPAWSNSLFEDNAAFGYGMLLAQKAIRDGLKTKVEAVMESEKASDEVKAACKEWIDTFSVGATNGAATVSYTHLDGEELPQIEEHPVALAMYILSPNSWVISFA